MVWWVLEGLGGKCPFSCMGWCGVSMLHICGRTRLELMNVPQLQVCRFHLTGGGENAAAQSQVFSVACGVWHTAAVAGQPASTKFGILHTGKAGRDASLLEPQRSADSASSVASGASHLECTGTLQLPHLIAMASQRKCLLQYRGERDELKCLRHTPLCNFIRDLCGCSTIFRIESKDAVLIWYARSGVSGCSTRTKDA